jgi:hypothetical protein
LHKPWGQFLSFPFLCWFLSFSLQRLRISMAIFWDISRSFRPLNASEERFLRRFFEEVSLFFLFFASHIPIDTLWISDQKRSGGRGALSLLCRKQFKEIRKYQFFSNLVKILNKFFFF